MMKQVAKLVIVDEHNLYLLLYRNNHPKFGSDPDLPGGTLEGDESPLEAMLREVQEEAGAVIGKEKVKEVYMGADYSKHGTCYSLFVAKLPQRPEVILSWEHSSYAWVSREDFLLQAKSANDTYMHMVYDTLNDSRL
jgi:8-oxo-dGTP pyrophosphatase MutT (NUDIX family)